LEGAHHARPQRSIPPAVTITLIYVLGIVVSDAAAPSIATLAWASVFLAGLGLSLWQSERLPTIAQGVLTLGLLAAAALRTQLASQPAPNDVSHFASGERVVVEGLVCRYPERRGDRTMLRLDVSRVWSDEEAWQPAQGRVLVRLHGSDATPRYGDLIRVDARLRRTRPARNPGEFNYRRYLLAEGVTATMSVYRAERVELVQSGGGWWLLRDLVYPLKDWITQRVNAHVRGTEAALIQSLLLGERGGLPEDVREGFARSGVIHVLAVSGLHVGFVILVSLAIFTLLRVPRSMTSLLTLVLLLFYVYLTNVRPSVVRASIMGGLLLVAHDLQRRTPVANSLALAALIILIFSPLALFQASFQLSFAAVLGIVYLYRPLDQLLVRGPLRRIKRHALGRYTLGLLLVSLAAQMGTLPLSAFYFGRIPLVALFANLLVIPLVFAVVGFAAIALIVTPLWSSLAHLYWEASGFSATAVLTVVDHSSRLPMASVDYPRPDLVHAGLFAAVLILLLSWRKRWGRVAALVITLLSLNLAAWRAAAWSPSLEVVFFDVGQADAALVTAPNGRTLLIDSGDRWQGSDAGQRTILPYLRRRGIRRLDAVIFTHAHEDHYGGLPSLLRAVDVGVVYGPQQENPAKTFDELVSLADSLGVPLRTLWRGDQIEDFEPLRLFVLHPTESFLGANPSDGKMNLNEGSVVLKLQYGEQSVLFTGDAEREAEGQFVRYGRFLRSSVLKVGHHGSRTSTGPDLVNRVEPKFAVVSVGEVNSYGLPDEEPLDLLRQVGAVVLRTDQVGAVVIRSDGHRLWRTR
jgi:competence protein ComEC